METDSQSFFTYQDGYNGVLDNDFHTLGLRETTVYFSRSSLHGRLEANSILNTCDSSVLLPTARKQYLLRIWSDTCSSRQLLPGRGQVRSLAKASGLCKCPPNQILLDFDYLVDIPKANVSFRPVTSPEVLDWGLLWDQLNVLPRIPPHQPCGNRPVTPKARRNEAMVETTSQVAFGKDENLLTAGDSHRPTREFPGTNFR